MRKVGRVGAATAKAPAILPVQICGAVPNPLAVLACAPICSGQSCGSVRFPSRCKRCSALCSGKVRYRRQCVSALGAPSRGGSRALGRCPAPGPPGQRNPRASDRRAGGVQRSKAPAKSNVRARGKIEARRGENLRAAVHPAIDCLRLSASCQG